MGPKQRRNKIAEDARNITKKKALAKDIIKRREMEEEHRKRPSKERTAKTISKRQKQTKEAPKEMPNKNDATAEHKFAGRWRTEHSIPDARRR